MTRKKRGRKPKNQTTNGSGTATINDYLHNMHVGSNKHSYHDKNRILTDSPIRKPSNNGHNSTRKYL